MAFATPCSFVGDELDADAKETFKCEMQHQEFGLGVDERPLPGREHPGPANLQISVFPFDVAETGRPDDASRIEEFDCERDDSSVSLTVQRQAM